MNSMPPKLDVVWNGRSGWRGNVTRDHWLLPTAKWVCTVGPVSGARKRRLSILGPIRRRASQVVDLAGFPGEFDCGNAPARAGEPYPCTPPAPQNPSVSGTGKLIPRDAGVRACAETLKHAQSLQDCMARPLTGLDGSRVSRLRGARLRRLPLPSLCRSHRQYQPLKSWRLQCMAGSEPGVKGPDKANPHCRRAGATSLQRRTAGIETGNRRVDHPVPALGPETLCLDCELLDPGRDKVCDETCPSARRPKPRDGRRARAGIRASFAASTQRPPAARLRQREGERIPRVCRRPRQRRTTPSVAPGTAARAHRLG